MQFACLLCPAAGCLSTLMCASVYTHPPAGSLLLRARACMQARLQRPLLVRLPTPWFTLPCAALLAASAAAAAAAGLWLHGNLLDSLPEELGRLSALTQLSLSGNRLTTLPASLAGLQVGAPEGGSRVGGACHRCIHQPSAGPSGTALHCCSSCDALSLAL